MPKTSARMRPLHADMLAVTPQAVPAPPAIRKSKPKVVPWGDPLNLRVTPEFKREFQLRAAKANVRYTEILHQSFEALLMSSSPEPGSVEPPPKAEGDKSKESMNFRVTPEFRIAFRTYAVQRRLRLNDVIVLAFQALKDSSA